MPLLCDILMNKMIKCLPADVQGKLRSGVAVPSLQQCVEELILNSIDAEATCVGVRMDMEALKLQVIDNGTGINAEDMENIGNRYYTSKCSSIEDMDNLRWYGFRGEALASVVSLATLVEISSRTRSSVKTHVKLFKDGKGLDVFEAETARPSAGTTVVICSFFHNMPVRRKRIDSVLEGERIRHRVEAFSLMHPSVSFTLKNDCTGAMMVQLPKARNTYSRFIQIHSLGRAQKLGEISHTHGQFEVIGHIGREGHYNNSLQYLYVNERLLLKTRLHKLLNFLLRRLSSSNQKIDSPDGPSAIRSPKHNRSQEQHGVYIINIKCPYSEYDICLEPAKTLIEFRDWDGILLCVEEAVKAFLCKENLVAELSQDDLDYLSPKLFGTCNADQEGHQASDVGQETSRALTLDCSIGLKLASHCVHRKSKTEGACEETVCSDSGQIQSKKETEHIGEESVNLIELENSESKAKTECEGKLDGPEPECNSDLTGKEEESILCKVREGFHICRSSPVLEKLANEKLLNSYTSLNNETSLQSIPQQVQPDLKNMEQNSLDCEGTDTQGQDLKWQNRKISLCNPYIHESLQTEAPSHTDKPTLEKQSGGQSFVSKRKISLCAVQDRSDRKQCRDFAAVIPSKVPRTVATQKLSIYGESGSLEKFRRLYGKSAEKKLPSHDAQPGTITRLPQEESFFLNDKDLVWQKAQQDGEFKEAEKEETQRSLGSQPALSVFTKLKQFPKDNISKTSLAAKLRHLKQNKTENSEEEPHLSGSVSLDSSRRCAGSDDVRDSNNNNNPGDSPLMPEPDPGSSSNPELAGKEEARTSGDWLQHYDASVGKTVYVNKVTGLSRYEDPPSEETQVCCASDVTNMAVSVISEMGVEYRCYPFQMEIVLPFIPKSRTDRVLNSGCDIRDDSDEASNSLTLLYSKWNNPVFVRPPTVGVDISRGEAAGLAVKVHNILFPYRFSKDMIHSMKVIHQVDRKFVACLINTKETKPTTQADAEGNLLVLVDQHAAHERVRLENLVADSYEDDPDVPGKRRLCSSKILPPLEISVTEEQLRLLRSCQPHLRSLGLEVTFSEAAGPKVFVGKVPLCFIEKESNELRRGRPSVIKPIVQEYLREQIELLCSTGRVRGTLPLTVLKVLASLACHGAIKFNDTLSKDECCSLVASLSSCQLPFQCAHGRPSITPLVDILHLDKDQMELQKPNLQKLRRMYKAWQLYGNR